MNSCKDCKNRRNYTEAGKTTNKHYCLYKKKRLLVKEMSNKECFNIDFVNTTYDDVKDALEKIYEEQSYEKEVTMPLFYKYLDSVGIKEKLEQGRIISRFFSDYTYKQSVGGLLKKPYFNSQYVSCAAKGTPMAKRGKDTVSFSKNKK